jgi:multiple sugar transport system ATP-binding protein
VRIASHATARPGEVPMTGLVRHLEFQGHEVLVHFDTGSSPAVIPQLEAARPDRPARRRRREGTVLDRLLERTATFRSGGSVAVLDNPADTQADAFAPTAETGRLFGDLVVRTTPDLRLRHGMQVPLLVDLAHLFVFDQHGQRVCPAPAHQSDLGE